MASAFGTAFIVEKAARLDQLLSESLPDTSRREAKRLLDSGRVTLNGRVIAVASRMLKPRDRIAVLAPDATLPILDLNDQIVVVDKPAALPSQPSPANSNPSVIDVVSSMLRARGDLNVDAYVVHRLDTNTTGVMLIGRSSTAADQYARIISGGDSRKSYLAIVEGAIDAAFEVDEPIGRIDGNLFGVTARGKRARSSITPLEANDRASLLRVDIATGRTHQIRVHLAHSGHAVIGDRKYGSGEHPFARRQMLHSWRLAIPGGHWESDPPDDFSACAEAVGLGRSW